MFPAWLKTGTIILLLFLGALFVAEWGARITVSMVGLEPMAPLVIGQPDPDLGWALVPGAHATSHWGDTPVEYRINNLGARDSDTTYAKPSGVFRIVVLGDSVTFGAGVPISQHFTRLLEGYFDGVEVINLGVSGYGVDQELMMLRQQGLRYQPDLVLVYVDHYASQRHMHAFRWGKHKPLFALRDDGRLVQVERPPEPEQGVAGLTQASHYWLRRQSRLYQIASEIFQIVFTDTPSNSAQNAEDERLMADPAYRERTQALGAALVGAMRDDANRAGAGFVLMTRVPELAKRLRASGAQVLEVNQALSNPALTLVGDPHPNAAANGILAWELFQYLQAKALVPQAHNAEKQ